MNKIQALKELATEHIQAAERISMHQSATGACWHRDEAKRIAELIAQLRDEQPQPYTTPTDPPWTWPDVICYHNNAAPKNQPE